KIYERLMLSESFVKILERMNDCKYEFVQRGNNLNEAIVKSCLEKIKITYLSEKTDLTSLCDKIKNELFQYLKEISYKKFSKLPKTLVIDHIINNIIAINIVDLAPIDFKISRFKTKTVNDYILFIIPWGKKKVLDGGAIYDKQIQPFFSKIDKEFNGIVEEFKQQIDDLINQFIDQCSELI